MCFHDVKNWVVSHRLPLIYPVWLHERCFTWFTGVRLMRNSLSTLFFKKILKTKTNFLFRCWATLPVTQCCFHGGGTWMLGAITKIKSKLVFSVFCSPLFRYNLQHNSSRSVSFAASRYGSILFVGNQEPFCARWKQLSCAKGFPSAEFSSYLWSIDLCNNGVTETKGTHRWPREEKWISSRK